MTDELEPITRIEMLYNDDREEVKTLEEATWKYVTLFDEDTILCFGGVHLLWKGVGECWIMLSNEGKLKPLTVAKYTIKLFDDIMSKDSLVRMQASVSASDPKAISFAKWLGFEVEGLMKKYGPDGNDYYRLARIR